MPDALQDMDAADLLLILVTAVALAAFLGALFVGCRESGRLLAGHLRRRHHALHCRPILTPRRGAPPPGKGDGKARG
ncbi:MAG TPA: hypothetical protein VKY65_03010 [Alphaproteobacteria bacterium]|nr:hypothetical protein [Alphaproteobacteria bacterium]